MCCLNSMDGGCAEYPFRPTVTLQAERLEADGRLVQRDPTSTRQSWPDIGGMTPAAADHQSSSNIDHYIQVAVALSVRHQLSPDSLALARALARAATAFRVLVGPLAPAWAMNYDAVASL